MQNKKIIKEIFDCHLNKKSEKNILCSDSGDEYSFKDLKKITDTLRNDLKSIIDKNSRVAILMPMGFTYSLLTLVLNEQNAVLPLNSSNTIKELKDFFYRFKIEAVFVDNSINLKIINLAKKEKVSVLKYKKIKNNKIYFEILYKGNKKMPNYYKEKNIYIDYILPTSGTTAKSKIVCLNNSMVMAGARNIIKHLKLSEKDICLNIMPLYHVHGLMVLIASLLSGGRVISTPKYNNSLFYGWLQEFKPTWYTASAGIQENILLRSEENRDKIKDLKLRFIRSSSAPLSPQTTKGLEKFFNAPIAESYGMTEATLQITTQPLPPKKKKIGSCGRPTELELAIVDKENNFVNSEELGEIVIKGDNVIKEYENNKEANKKSFWKDWLRTGDLGYLDRDGFLFIKGRIKEMINKGGENISPREIDEALMMHKAVELAVAFSVPHKTLGEDIAIAVICKKGHMVKEEELRRFLKDKLADYKIPSVFYFVDDVPKTAVGKPKRVGLYKEIKKIKNKKSKIKSSLQLELLTIFKKVLKAEINIDDNFFEAGGDSLQAEEIIHEISKKGYKINILDIQNNPTISRLSLHIVNKN